MEVFEEYLLLDKFDKISLVGDMKNWTQFKIYIFTKTKTDLLKGLNSLNKLFLKHRNNKFEEFSVRLEEDTILLERSFLVSFQGKIFFKMLFNFLIDFWTMGDKNSIMMQGVSRNNISILYYFNDENIDLEIIFSVLNDSAQTYMLHFQGWKLPFTMTVSDSEDWNYDYFNRIEFVCKK